MPHYKDGTPAEVGDVVKGKGYNVKHEIIGKVVAVKPSDSCNLEVECVARPFGGMADEKRDAKLLTEYGETKAFEKIA